jgi:hypothetical protein
MTSVQAPTDPPDLGARPRSPLRSVGVPAEHGGWGLTFEPVLLGLIVAPSVAGIALAVAALLAFLCRTPLKFAVLDRRRHRRLRRTVIAERVAAIESVLIVALIIVAVSTASGRFWVPLVVAAPLFALELYFDVRSRGRRLVPELAGAVGISSIAAMIVLADGGDAVLAGGLWLLLIARAFASIPFVRAQIARIHGRSVSRLQLRAWETGALAIAATTVVLDVRLLAGAVAIAVLVLAQVRAYRQPVPRMTIVGVQQMALGVAVVLATSVGVLAS